MFLWELALSKIITLFIYLLVINLSNVANYDRKAS
jgi:hypothetical protein